MASYARLVKVKARAAKWKKRYKQADADVERMHLIHNDLQVIISRLRSRIKQLETTNEYLDGKIKYQEKLIKAQGEKIDYLYKEIGPDAFLPAEINVIGREK